MAEPLWDQGIWDVGFWDTLTFAIAPGTRLAPEARKGTRVTTVTSTPPTWAGTSLGTWQTFGTWSGADLFGEIRKGTR